MGKLRYSELSNSASDPVSGIGRGRVPPGGYKDSIIDAPSTVANYEYLLGALRSKAPGQWSQNVLELSNHFTSAAFLAINTLANQAAACEHGVYERTYDENESDLKLSWSEPICRFLAQPNDDDDWNDLVYQISQQLSLTGIALVWKPTWTDGQIPNELYVLPTASCLPWPPSPIYPHGSYLVQPYYPYGPFSTIPSYQSAAGARIPAEQVIRIKNPHPILRYDGYAVLTALRQQVDTIDGIDRARWNTQMRGADPSLAVTFDPKVFNIENQPELNRLRVQMDAMYAGANNAGKILPVPIGASIEKISTTPAEMAWQEGWDQLVKFVMASYGCPAPIAGLTDSTSYATLYASQKQFNLISLDPHLSRIASKFNSGLIKPYFGEDLYLKLEGQKITDEDMELKRLDLAMKGKAVKVNELRKVADLAPLDGPEGDEFAGDAPHNHIHQAPQAQEAGTQEQDPDIVRPENPAGNGSLPPRKSRVNRLAEVLDNHKHNGSLKNLNSEEKDYFLNFAK